MNDSIKTQRHTGSTVMITSSSDVDGKVDLEPYLVILSGQKQGKHFPLNKQQNTIGRVADVDILIEDPKISRNHGAFIVYPDSIVLEDYHSTNGCYVDGVRVESKVIESTERIQIGNTLMKIEYKKAHEVESEQALFEAANTDELTGLLNRRAFMTRAQEEYLFCKRNNGSLAIIMCDIDYFKQVNDNFGHPAGDQVLRELATILQMRKEDIVARFGGEEFIVLLRDTDSQASVSWAERTRKTVEQFSFSFQETIIPTTLSMGICCKNGEQMISLEGLIKEADDALYQAKKNGRNRAVLA